MLLASQPDAARAQPDSLPATLAGAGPANAPIRVLFVEDDYHCGELVSRQLSKCGFAVRSFVHGGALLAALDDDAEADVIVVVDWALSTSPGLGLLGQLHRRGVGLPVVFLNGHPAAATDDLALQGGATGRVDKTPGLDALVARLKRAIAAARLTVEPAPAKDIVSGKLVLRMAINRACWNGVDVGLTVSEFRILHLIMSRPGSFVTCRSIYDCMRSKGFVAGSGDDGYRNNVRSAIKRLRNKFRQLDADFAEIENCTGFGYRWKIPDGLISR